MEIRIFQSQDRMLVQLVGRVVLDECDRLKSAVVPRIVPGVSQVNLDLSGVDFIDSAGLGVLVGMKVSSNKSRAKLALVAPSKGVSDILMVSKLDSIFDIVTGDDAKNVIRTLATDANRLADRPGGGADSSATAGPTFHAPPAPTAPSTQAASPKERIDQLCKAAVEHMRTRDYDRAVDCYRQALEIDPNYLPAHNNLGIVYEKKPEWKELAIRQWEKVLQLSQSRGDAKHVERAQKHLDDLQRV